MPTKKTKTAKTKKAVKKVAKKTTRRKRTGLPLVYSSDSTSFWVSDGQILNSLTALRDALDVMDREVYKLHATGKQNDFANWVEVVLCDAKCATELLKAKTQKSAKAVVIKHLKRYSI